jgi:hypothetical protein
VAETFPLPRSGTKLLRLILIGYLHEGGNDRKPASPTAVGGTVGLDSTVVSRNNAFLAAVGLIEAGEHRQWRLTEAGVEIARAYEYEAQEEVEERLNELLRANEFVRRVAAFVGGRGGVDQDVVVSHMARLAGVRKTSEFLTGARALLELMLMAGLVESDGEVIRVASAREGQATGAQGPRAAVKPSRGAPRNRPYGGGVTVGLGPPGAENIVVNLNVTVQASDIATDAKAKALAARIRQLMESVTSPDAESD